MLRGFIDFRMPLCTVCFFVFQPILHSPDVCIDCILCSCVLYFIYAVGPIAKRLAVELEARSYLRSR